MIEPCWNIQVSNVISKIILNASFRPLTNCCVLKLFCRHAVVAKDLTVSMFCLWCWEFSKSGKVILVYWAKCWKIMRWLPVVLQGVAKKLTMFCFSCTITSYQMTFWKGEKFLIRIKTLPDALYLKLVRKTKDYFYFGLFPMKCFIYWYINVFWIL